MTTGVLATPPILQFFAANGNPLVGGSVLTQVGGVNTATYSDSGLTTALPNPIPLNARGEISTAAGASAQCFLTPNTVYTFTVSDANGNQIWVANYVDGVALTGEAIAAELNTVTNTAALASYVRTAAEIAAGVTPVNYAYPPGAFERYGADPSATGVVNTAAIQNAINVQMERVFSQNGGTFLVAPQTSGGLSGVFGANSVCIYPTSDQVIDLTGVTLKLEAGYTATSGAIIGNLTTFPLSNVTIINGTLDGSNGGQCSGIQLVDAVNCKIDKVTSSANGYNGIGIRRYAGVPYDANAGSFECAITNCTVNTAGYIGIQVSRPIGVSITGNKVYSSVNNAIDIEGNNTAGDPGYGRANIISGNYIQSPGSEGIFVESIPDYVISGNIVEDAAANPAIYLNRINSGASYGIVTGNKLINNGTQQSYGLYINNSVEGVHIADNFFQNFSSSIYITGTSSFISVGVNHHKSIARYCVEFPTAASSIAHTWVGKQVTEDQLEVSGGLPSLTPPYGCPSNNPTRASALTTDGIVSLYGGLESLGNYQIGFNQLVTNSTWGAAALYNSGGDGKTRIWFAAAATGLAPGTNAVSFTTGDFLVIDGQTYQVGAAPGDGSFYVEQWNGTAYVDGNFVADLSAGQYIDVYSSYWGSN